MSADIVNPFGEARTVLTPVAEGVVTHASWEDAEAHRERVGASGPVRTVHCIAVGGVGVSAVALLLRARGYVVTGSDRAEGESAEVLREAGVTVHIGHDAAHVAGADLVVVSTAIPASNPEVVAALEANLPIIHRAAALAHAVGGAETIALAGTHGKTSTSSMAAVALTRAGADPSFAVGAIVRDLGRGAAVGEGPQFVVEADESDGSFVAYRPRVAVITNLEPDHLDFHGTFDAVQAAFFNFTQRIVEGGALVVCADDAGVMRFAQSVPASIRRLTYGFADSADVRILDFAATPEGSVSRVRLADAREVEVRLRVLGRHQMQNAVGVLAALLDVGTDLEGALRGLAEFGGATRRFEVRGVADSVHVVDDYAHHPTEIEATIAAARDAAPGGRVVVGFQPHLFSRTRNHFEEFVTALCRADLAVLAPIYPAREEFDPTISSQMLAEACVARGGPVEVAADLDAVLARLVDASRPGDIVLTMGAGDITTLGPRLVEALRGRQQGGATHE
ncbi:UDP-N-acetylmuramate--L-alanine ligase [Micrococcales bacterium 31B]|nr:UDP-N-acetylmuramate--L-alanine ligase [Micrococcales bacterium 31B]